MPLNDGNSSNISNRKLVKLIEPLVQTNFLNQINLAFGAHMAHFDVFIACLSYQHLRLTIDFGYMIQYLIVYGMSKTLAEQTIASIFLSQNSHHKPKNSEYQKDCYPVIRNTYGALSWDRIPNSKTYISTKTAAWFTTNIKVFCVIGLKTDEVVKSKDETEIDSQTVVLDQPQDEDNSGVGSQHQLITPIELETTTLPLTEQENTDFHLSEPTITKEEEPMSIYNPTREPTCEAHSAIKICPNISVAPHL